MTFELRPGDKAGIIAPSRWLKGPDDLTAGLRYLKDRGIQPVIGPHVFDTWRYMAGTIADRAADIMEFYKIPKSKPFSALAAAMARNTCSRIWTMTLSAKTPNRFLATATTTLYSSALFRKPDKRPTADLFWYMTSDTAAAWNP